MAKTIMGNMGYFLTSYLLVLTMLFSANAQFVKKTYLVQMDKAVMPKAFTNHLEWYSSKLKSALSTSPEADAESEKRIIYTYQNAFHGVAAKLTEGEAKKLEAEEGVVAIFPDTKYELHTTRSPAFLGLQPEKAPNMWSEKLSGRDVIVGVLDTGIWPESESFKDVSMGPVPAHWKGACEIGTGFTKSHCNKKVVGARVFYHGYEAAIGRINEQKEYKSPRDQDGHGTHTAATVGGSPVLGANLLGYANGTARGMAPGARIAAYKVCWVGGCFSSDIVSAIDKAVADGVDILSISLGGGVSSYYRDSLSVAAFGAMEKGVFVSCSAGNAGPDPASLTNVSPWITTVGASTMDRDFPAEVKLGNGKIVTGVSLYKGQSVLSIEKQYPLVYLGSNSSRVDPRSMCLEGTMDPKVVSGKIVICDRGLSPRVQKGNVVRSAGGVGMILTNTEANGEELVADCHLLPAVAIGEKEGKDLKSYVLSGKSATATLAFKGTRLGIRPSPVVAAFSSRGPNFLSLEILKPDLVAPGVNILAAWSEAIGPSGLKVDNRREKFNILSGTSMSCPHVSGVAAFLKARHPEWSPAAIKSALMTTAYVLDNTKKTLTDASTAKPSSPYDHGSGHIDPIRAVDPGLVYDIEPQDYFEFLCTQNLTPTQLQVFAKFSNRSCKHSLASPGDLNYPAISSIFTQKTATSFSRPVIVHRTVTNVGPADSKYQVVISPFEGASVKVEPETLNFTKEHQKLSYKITFTPRVRQTSPEFGSLVWKDGLHTVRSPIVITWLAPPM
ncbi:subtilisin-like protease SBT1.3 [Vigna radiata var. radiata]|uniref:Subtilisin-like protease SBT1.3 n=1 Tax=Vigna radiata var. radiata TaxID=3916 RepID=A0A1S3UX84_VIGRR|nr:subtilisin-like protease SBT1.3 [Vigna radiata var. radiata]